jgi:DNA repair protein RadD
VCAVCGGTIKEPEAPKPIDAKLSYAALLSAQMQAVNTWHDVTRVDYKLHRKPGKPDSVRVDYYDGLLRCASEWICFDHGGFAAGKARQWCQQRMGMDIGLPSNTEQLLEVSEALRTPTRIATRKNGKFTEVKEYEFTRTERHQDAPEEAIEGS